MSCTCPNCGVALSLSVAGADPPTRREIHNEEWGVTHFALKRFVSQAGFDFRNANLYGGRKYMRVDAPFGRGIVVANSSGVIENVNVHDCPGDGITIGSKDYYEHAPAIGLSRNVTLHNVTVDNCRRNALSIIGAEDVLLENVRLLNTVDTYVGGPGAGLDFEPDEDSGDNRRIVLHDFLIEGHERYAVICDEHAYATTEGVTFSKGIIRASKTGWAIWGAGFKGVNAIRDVDIYGPCVHLRNLRFEGVRFHADPENRQEHGQVSIASQHENVTFDEHCTFD